MDGFLVLYFSGVFTVRGYTFFTDLTLTLLLTHFLILGVCTGLISKLLVDYEVSIAPVCFPSIYDFVEICDIRPLGLAASSEIYLWTASISVVTLTGIAMILVL